MTRLTWAHLSDVGRTRKNNQDSLAVVEAPELGGQLQGLFMVADGMGGHAGGEVASRVAIEVVPKVVRETLAASNGHVAGERMAAALRKAFAAANEAIREKARSAPELRSMGTTCVAALIGDGLLAVGNVGDSRLYMLREGELIQVTKDHSLVQEYIQSGEMSPAQARQSRFRNILTRAVGIAGKVEADVEVVALQEGDILLLCSDGLTNMVAEPEIARILGTVSDPDEACRQLVETANRNGGEDNITVVIVHNGAFREVPIKTQAQEPLPPPAPSLFPVPAPPSRRSPDKRNQIMMLVCFFVIGAILGYATARSSESSPPPSPPAPAQTPPPSPPADAPPPDFGSLLYDAPVVIFEKPIRGAPLAADPAGNIYATTDTGRIYLIAPDGSSFRDLGAPVKSLGQEPRIRMTADSQGNVYIVSKTERCIYRFDSKGTRRGVIGAGQLQAPEDIAVDSQANIYVVDKGLLKLFRARHPAEKRSEATNAAR
jgi:serine/threonine protein phosphatase PrpC